MSLQALLKSKGVAISAIALLRVGAALAHQPVRLYHLRAHLGRRVRVVVRVEDLIHDRFTRPCSRYCTFYFTAGLRTPMDNQHKARQCPTAFRAVYQIIPAGTLIHDPRSTSFYFTASWIELD